MEKDKPVNEVEKEIEILEFRSGGYSYGVDLNDVREILPNKSKLLPIPNAHPFIEGIIKPRDFLIPIINFEKSLKLAAADEFKTDMLIVSSINDLNIAFRVDSVKSIHKVFPSTIEKPGKKLTTTLKDC